MRYLRLCNGLSDRVFSSNIPAIKVLWNNTLPNYVRSLGSKTLDQCIQKLNGQLNVQRWKLTTIAVSLFLVKLNQNLSRLISNLSTLKPQIQGITRAFLSNHISYKPRDKVSMLRNALKYRVWGLRTQEKYYRNLK